MQSNNSAIFWIKDGKLIQRALPSHLRTETFRGKI